MRTGITFGEWDLPEAAALGAEIIRTDVPASGPLDAFVEPLVAAPVDFCFILHDVARTVPLLDAMYRTQFDTARAYLEPFNEREQGRVTPAIMVDAVETIYRELEQRGAACRVVASGDSALSSKTLVFYREIAPDLPFDCILAFHDYPYKTQPKHRPWPFFTSHEQAIEAFLDTVDQPAACSEFGFHTAEEIETDLRGDVVYQGRLSDEQVYTFLVEYFRRYDSYALQFAIAYQWRDGATDDAMGRFGVHTQDGARKRQAAALRDWRHPVADTIPVLIGETLLTSADPYMLIPSKQAGKYNLARASDGKVLSLQPDGTPQWRDPGTDDPFERCELVGNALQYQYQHDGKYYRHAVACQRFSGVWS